jgi:pentatricopeptide repeat protein
VFAYGCLMHALGRARQWEQGLALLDAMKRAKVRDT